MARNQETLTIPHNEQMELTNDDVERITFAVLSGSVEIRVESTATTTGAHGLPYASGMGELQKPLSELTETGGSRVVAIGRGHPESKVFVDHA